LVAFTRDVLAQDRVRLIGVCFGHQIIGRAMGVKVDRSDRGWEVSVTAVRLTGKGRKLFGVEELVSSFSMFSLYLIRWEYYNRSSADTEVLSLKAIHQMHRDIVYAYPDGVEHLGHSPRCEVQGMYAPRRLISVQGHPEFNGEIVAELLENRHDKGIFDDAMYRDGMSRVRKHHDGVAVGAAFVRFLLEE